ncbi:MAG: molybdopterin molybdotransferase MoeA [Deltaproteobacteria bacterium]|nr:molybdopterin molybdotransferase MoeA [Deltaproteobacteria bacterium]
MTTTSTPKAFFKVVTPAEAFEALCQVSRVEAEPVRTTEARGRVLAEDLYSQVDLPHFNRAGMDGYAVIARDTFGASPALPAYLRLVGAVEMGEEATRRLGVREAVRISTGGMLPPGSDAVVMVEHTEETGDGAVEIYRAASPWLNVIQVGDDIRKGEPVFPRGRRLRAHDLGALTGIGIASVSVYRRPRVTLISTGDEIVAVDREPRPGQVRNINQHSLAGLIAECGAELKDLGVVPDQPEALHAALTEGLGWGDLVLLSGGSSMGTRDMAVEVIRSLPDSRIFFHGISVSPGKPTIYAHAAGKPVLGLPGYPVSALVIFDLFAAPLIRALSGESTPAARMGRNTLRAVMDTNVSSQTGREDYIRVTIERRSETVYATPLPSKSGAIFTLVKADGMVCIDLNSEGLEQGEEVEVLLF